MNDMRKMLKNHFIPQAENNYKPHSVRKESLIATLIFGVFVVVMTVVGSHSVPQSSLLAQVQASLLTQLTNENRGENQIQSLTVNPLLEEAARLKAKDMLENQYFAHVSPEGKDPWYWFNQAGYKYKFAGENLASDYYDTDEVLKAWMDSPLHRKNILNAKYTEIGIAVETGRYKGRKIAFVVQMFGSPRYPVSNSAVVINNETPPVETFVSDSTTAPQVLGESVTAEEEVDTEPTSLETVFVEEPTTVDEETNNIESPSPVTTAVESDTSSYDNKLTEFLAQPGFVGKLALLALIILLSISLLLKVFFEFKKQHYKNVLWTLVVLIILIGLYILISSYLSQVVII